MFASWGQGIWNASKRLDRPFREFMLYNPHDCALTKFDDRLRFIVLKAVGDGHESGSESVSDEKTLCWTQPFDF